MGFWDSVVDPSKKRRNTTPPANDPYALQDTGPGLGADDEVTPVEHYDGLGGAEGDVNTEAADEVPTFDGVATGDMLENQWDAPVGDEPVPTPDVPVPTPDVPEIESVPGSLSTTDELSEDFNRSYLTGEGQDTADEEAYINQRILDQLGQQQVASRARMGRAGFGSSGALAAMEGDQMRQANLDAEGRVYDVREREQNQTFDQGMGAQQMDINQRDQAASEAHDKAVMDAINAMLNGGEAPAPAPPADDGNPLTLYDDVDARSAENQRLMELYTNAELVDSIPEGATPTGDPELFVSADGTKAYRLREQEGFADDIPGGRQPARWGG
jgi:hypothetical protein